MSKKLKKACALTVAGGMLFQLGCLSSDLLYQAAIAVGAGVTADFLTDNDSVFDLFQDDFGTGTTYDDRSTDNPTREEPDPAN